MSASDVFTFFSMGGYAIYVWGAYLIVLLWMIWEPLQVRRSHREVLRQLTEIPE